MRIALLGGFDAWLPSEQPLPIASRKLRALVSLLAVPPGAPRTRSQICAMLWSDRGDSQARASLRQALTELRKLLDPVGREVLIVGGDSVAFDPARLSVDVAELEQLIEMSTLQSLQKADHLYKGEFLLGLEIQDNAFQAWLRDERARLERKACEALTKLAQYLFDLGESDRAIEAVQRLLSIDPVAESAHRSLMKFFVSVGERPSALQQFDLCRETLLRELGVSPDPETEALALAIRQGHSVDGGFPHHRPSGTSFGGRAFENDKITISVIPFEDMNEDPSHARFASGLVEEVITALCRVVDFSVVLNSFALPEINTSRRLDLSTQVSSVDYFIKGSIRGSRGQMRISAQLIEGDTGNQVWAGKYDRENADELKTQDHVTHSIVSSVLVQLDLNIFQKALRKEPSDRSAFDLALMACRRFYDYTPEGLWDSQVLCEKALRRNPNSVPAHNVLSATLAHRCWMRCSDQPADDLSRARHHAEISAKLDGLSGRAHTNLGFILLLLRQHDRAIGELKRAIEINPNNNQSYGILATVLNFVGRPEEAIEKNLIALEVNPDDPGNFFRFTGLAISNYLCGEFETANEWAKRAKERKRSWYQGHLLCIASAAKLGQPSAAESAVREYLDEFPEGSIGDVTHLPFRDESNRAQLADGLHQARMPG